VFEVLQPGVQTTVQDLGRPGLRHWGVATGGALDGPALQRANLLLGNAPGAPALEVVLGPLALRFEAEGWLALTGGHFNACLDGRPLAPGYRTPFVAGQVLQLQAQAEVGARAYLAFSGGLQGPVVLGGQGSDGPAGLGFGAGRPLRRGDRLAWVGGWCPQRRLGLAPVEASATLRALPGPDHIDFSLRARQLFWNSEWRLSPQSNRMGARLSGPSLPPPALAELPSHAVLPGVVQVPPAGHPIVLLADAQSTGGYPRIASVIQADLWQLAQLPVGQPLRFVAVSREQALAALKQAREELATLRRHVALFP
jgi:5-oxoprolinase (ATP-hydrolysing) subunit C